MDHEEQHRKEIERVHERIDRLSEKVDSRMEKLTENIHVLATEVREFVAEIRKVGEPGKSDACDGHRMQLEHYSNALGRTIDTVEKLAERLDIIEKSRIRAAGFISGVGAVGGIIGALLTLLGQLLYKKFGG